MKFSNARAKGFDILGSGDAPRTPELDAASVRSWQKKVGYFSLFAGAAVIASMQAQSVSAAEPGKTVPARVQKRAAQMLKSIAAAKCSTPELLRRQSDYRLPGQKNQFNMFEVLAGGDNCPGNPVPPGTYTAANPYTDTGNTSGANSTVDFIPLACNGTYDQVGGPDHIYSFTLTAKGPVPQIRVTTTSNTYDLSIYVLDGTTGLMCPAGVGNEPTNCLVGADNTFFPNANEFVSASSLPLNTPLYLFVDSYYASVGQGGATGFGPYTVTFQDVTIGGGPTPPANDAPVDINGDGKTDFVTIRNTGGGPSGQATWYTSFQSGFPTNPTDWGIASDQFIPADFDGDGKDDFAVFRPGPQGVFYIVRSATNTLFTESFGTTGDYAYVVGDYTGDNRDDLAVYRAGATPGAPSTWFYRSIGSPPGVQSVVWGQNGDFPAPGDYDGDNKYDFVVQRTDPDTIHGQFWKRLATGAQSTEQFGFKDDSIVPGDYDGDHKTDLAVVRPDNGLLRWEFRPSGTPGGATVSDTWGQAATDFVAQGDYDGDGKTDYAVWRPGTPGTFFMMTVGTRIITTRDWGLTGDVPAANYNEH